MHTDLVSVLIRYKSSSPFPLSSLLLTQVPAWYLTGLAWQSWVLPLSRDYSQGTRTFLPF